MGTLGLRFILGRAGAGKTSRCLAEISGELRKDPAGPGMVFLVPEQATFQTEHALLRHCPGVLRAQVLSFRRLAYRVLLEAGGAVRPHIGELGKQMVLRALTNRRRGELQVFQRMAGLSGFGAKLAGVLAELKLYRLTPRDLQAAGTVLAQDDPLRDKLGDLALLYGDLEDYLAGRYTDPDDYLALLAARAPLAASLRGASFWLDAFAGFTPAEYLVLEAVLGVAGRMTVALCLDPGEEGDLFINSRETRATLEFLARRTGHAVEPPLVLDDVPRLALFPACGHLERHFFRRPSPPWPDIPTGISLLAATDRRAEVEAAAREMVRLAREEGLRFREMLVLVRDLEPYRDLLTTVLADFQIPFFIDYKRPVAGHPLVELIRGALGCALEDWSFGAVFRYLRTDLVNVAADRVDELENYVLAYGMRGGQWTTAWSRGSSPGAQELAARADQTRRDVAGPLAALHRVLTQAPSVREMTGALYGFLVDLGVPGRLEEWAAAATDGGRLAEAAEHAQIFAAVVELFDQVVEALGEEAMSLAEYASVLEDGLAALRLGLIPPGLDQVLVGSLDHSRNPEVRAAFVLGVNEGLLPARPPVGGFFTDAERERLAEAGMVLAPGARRRLLDEEYLVYLALTRASERLSVSYALAGEDGAALAPSLVVHRLREMLPGLTEASPGGALDQVTRPANTLSQLAVKLREAKAGGVLDDTWRAVYNWALGHWRQRLSVLTGALDYHNREKPLPREVCGTLFKSPLSTAVSRLEQFRACPFAHFLSYGLRLRERPVYELSPPDLGQFFHQALHLVGLRLAARNWGDLTIAESTALVRQVTGELAPGLANEILLSTARYRHLIGKLGRLLERSVQALAEHDRRGDFRPVALEAVFGPGGELPLLVFDLGEGASLELAGRIDRIDRARDAAGREYLRIIDYKSGPVDLNLNEVYQGVRLQLLVYLYAALSHWRESGQVLPGGVFYFQVQDPLLVAEGPPEPAAAARLALREFKMRGLVLGDPTLVHLMDNQLTSGYSDLIPVGLRADGGFYSSSAVLGPAEFEALLEHVRKLLMATGREILDGVVDIAPYRQKNTDACRFCGYRPVCRFDPLLERDAYRRIAETPAGEIVARLREGDCVD